MSSGPAIAIVHYHLRGGGVTQVIRQACEGLASSGASVVVLVGEHSNDADQISNVQVVEGEGRHDIVALISQEEEEALEADPRPEGEPSICVAYVHPIGDPDVEGILL